MESIDLAKSTPAGLSRRFHHLRFNPDRDPGSLLLVACALLHSACGRPAAPEALVLGFEYNASPEAAAIRVAYLTTGAGDCFTGEQVRVLLACTHGQFTLHDMLAFGARDHLDRHYSYWNKENGTRGLLVFGIHVDGKGRLSVEARGRANLEPGQAVSPGGSTGDGPSTATMPISRGTFDGLKAGDLAEVRWPALQTEIGPPRAILAVASALLLKAAEEVIPGRGCASVTFEFEGDSEATRIEIIDIGDDKGLTIAEGTFLVTWKPAADRTIASYLDEAVSRLASALGGGS